MTFLIFTCCLVTAIVVLFAALAAMDLACDIIEGAGERANEVHGVRRGESAPHRAERGVRAGRRRHGAAPRHLSVVRDCTRDNAS